MKILLALISPRRSGPSGAYLDLLHLYLERAAHYQPCSHLTFISEGKLLDFLTPGAGKAGPSRTRPALILADSRGQQLSSTEFSAVLGGLQDNGIQQVVLAIGPADGWSAAALARADKMIAFGRITLPHELAAVVLAEQIYRALTIRAGHPYHSGH